MESLIDILKDKLFEILMKGDEFSYDPENGPNDEMYRDQIEREFMKSLEKGENLTVYLYLPHYYISEKVRKHLDVMLLKEAYRNLFERNNNLVYEDEFLTIQLRDEGTFKIDMMKQMIDYFSSVEEYEKCAKVSAELNRLTKQ